ncbi:hypothetical protein EDB83DRAFT_2364599 [Lactarius deliciosus]|nr:hypothetical protein EDB83DRAFT_2364599 [Lactarius deliciosus]
MADVWPAFLPVAWGPVSLTRYATVSYSRNRLPRNSLACGCVLMYASHTSAGAVTIFSWSFHLKPGTA